MTADDRIFTATSAENEGSFRPGDWGLFAAVSAIWGSSFLLIDIGLDALEPGLITLLRVGLGALTLALLPRERRRVAREDRRRVVLLSILWVGVPLTLFPLAEQHINSAVTGLLNGATPIFAALVATFLLRRPPGPAQRAGIAVGFLGVVLISAPSISSSSGEALGVALVLSATLCYGFAVNLAAPLQQRYGSANVMATVLALGTVWTLPYGLFGVAESSVEWRPLLAVATLGIVGTGLAFLAMASLVGRVGSTRASLITYLIPVVSLVLGVALRNDSVSAIAVVGIAVVIAGALLAARPTGRDRDAVSQPTPATRR
ncbi:MAG: DMT family transporter [Ilumatobacteraceae bacterium]|nr:DMT family transporter [Ilumatobacteraceae bacterium]